MTAELMHMKKVFDAKTKTLAYGSNPYDGNSGQGGGADLFCRSCNRMAHKRWTDGCDI